MPSNHPLRQGSYRSLAAAANHFARESFMDELANLAKMDPLEFRLKNLTDARLREALQAAAQKFGWGKAKPQPGHGFGIAGGFDKSGYVATCAEVAVDPATGQVNVVRVVTAFDCGAVVNPDQLRNQIEGANIMGIGGALFEAIQVRKWPYPEPALCAVSRAALQRRSGDGSCPDRSEGCAFGGGRRNSHRGHCAGHRQRYLRGHR